MGQRPCTRCPKCGSDLALGPESHITPRPHCMIVAPVDAVTDAGVVQAGKITRCVYCNLTAHEISLRGEPMESYESPEAIARREADAKLLKELQEKWRNQ